MQTKLLSAAILTIGLATIGNAQELQPLKSYPHILNGTPDTQFVPFSSQNYKSFPYLKLYANSVDTAHFSHATIAGDVFIAPLDGMPILRTYSKSTDYETNRTKIIKPYAAEPFGKPSIVEPMPNALNKALIFEEKSN